MPPRGPSLLSVALLLGASACGPTPAVRCPEPAAASEPTSAPRAPDPDPGPAPAPRAEARAGVRPTQDFPIPSNCEAPLAITQEVTRLLTASAAHATRSKACVDGPGQRRAINDILVCPAPSSGKDQTVEVFYQVVTYPEGDTRSCSEERPCDWLAPTASEHQVRLTLRPTAKDPERGTLADLPEPLPGFPDATPLADEHDGDCYGSSAPFIPAEIRIAR